MLASKVLETSLRDGSASNAVIDRNQPPNLVKEHHPPLLDRTIAADLEWPRRRRRQGR
jgi:hypothetical protein